MNAKQIADAIDPAVCEALYQTTQIMTKATAELTPQQLQQLDDIRNKLVDVRRAVVKMKE